LGYFAEVAGEPKPLPGLRHRLLPTADGHGVWLRRLKRGRLCGGEKLNFWWQIANVVWD
jgi:hypothetical protein